MIYHEQINLRGFALCWLIMASPVLYCGCGGTRLDVPEPGTYSPLIAVSLGITASESNPSPAPNPTPAPSGKCENCNGTGRLGDGTVSVPCPVCGGDGKIESTADEIVPSLPKPASVVVPTADDHFADSGKMVDPYAPPPRVTLPKSNPPLVNSEDLCTDGSCAVQGGGGRRGLFGRWRR